MQSYMIFLVYGLFFVAVWYFMIRPQKKKQQDLTKMRNELVVGDEIVTIGGIVGKVAAIREDELHIQTGSSADIIVIKKWAVGNINK